MVYLLFEAERERPAPRWAFWSYDYASVYAWLDAPNLDIGKSRAENTLRRKGWRIVRYEHATKMTDAELPNEMYARACIKMARANGSSYTFERIPRPACGDALDGGAREFSDSTTEPLDIDPARVPAALRPAVEIGRRWAIGDDPARSRAIRTALAAERQALLDVVEPLWDEIERWCDTRRDQTPVPDEVVLFDHLLEAATEMQAGAEADSPQRT